MGKPLIYERFVGFGVWVVTLAISGALAGERHWAYADTPTGVVALVSTLVVGFYVVGMVFGFMSWYDERPEAQFKAELRRFSAKRIPLEILYPFLVLANIARALLR